MRKLRGEIAHQTNTPDAENFGTPPVFKKLITKEQKIGITRTSLYTEYNVSFLKELAEKIAPMEHTLKEWKQTRIRYTERQLGRKMRTDIEVLTVPSIAEQELAREITLFELNEMLGTDKKEDQMARDWELNKKLKRVFPDFYKRISRHNMLMSLIKYHPSPVRKEDGSLEGNEDNLKCLYPISTIRVQVKGKLYAIGTHITWMYMTLRTDPVERMIKCSKASVIHQDVFLIEDTLQAIAEIFSEAILWDKKAEELEALKDKVALIRFMYAFCMPCLRGDGAIGDWMELAVYKYHGFKNTRHNSKTMPCFEPLASTSFSSYRERYNETIEIVE